ncbi:MULTISPECIES: methyltransferase [unclassified Streptomyces]|uniref:class I SAM-dependent methyltransferase n=1 Tax=unclassified Streptomyces TaxID=2593676 RepID=UPI002DD9BC59|nr:methyltransferase [Streptomyces sp. NBC_01775]WSB75812.1 methyltransferase domain-containing protein [Streptomyces sp. NBC_01775]WSS44751.1 methyltransferase domain-containing protein [Streptomyces sp. NBC_01187]
MRRDMGEHYQNLASAYDDNWAYSPAFIRWMSEQIASALELSADDRMADIGCGTGLFARKIAEVLHPHRPLLCVDPSTAMLDQLPSSPALSPLGASAEEIANQTVTLPYEQLDAMWLKESVHHVTDPAATLGGLARLLAPGGRLLVAMLPTTIAYPLFAEALKRYEERQPDPAGIAQHLTDAGLRAELTFVEHELRLDKERYLAMVRARYMSVLSTFSDEELDTGIEEIRARHPEPELVFPDRFAFVLGVREDSSDTTTPGGGAR